MVHDRGLFAFGSADRDHQRDQMIFLRMGLARGGSRIPAATMRSRTRCATSGEPGALYFT